MKNMRATAIDIDKKRPLIRDLLNKYSSEISRVLNKIKPHELYDPSRYDDIWVLRFVLSHKGSTTKATQAAIKTMEFRDEKKLNKFGDILHRIYNHEDHDSPSNFPILKKYFSCIKTNAIIHQLPDTDRGIVCYIRLADCDMKKMVKTLSEEELSEVYLLLNEAVYQIQDDISRRSGRLTKLLKVIDLDGMKMKEFDIGYAKVDAAAAKTLEDFYPQQLGKILVVNAPYWINMVWDVLKPLFPARVTEKFDFASSKKKMIKKLVEYVSADNVPERFGGNDKCWPHVYAGDFIRNEINMSKQCKEEIMIKNIEGAICA